VRRTKKKGVAVIVPDALSFVLEPAESRSLASLGMTDPRLGCFLVHAAHTASAWGAAAVSCTGFLGFLDVGH
jgi:hypothetical protein